MNGFYEDDEPVEKVVEAFKRGEKKRTEEPWKFRMLRALDSALHAVHLPWRWICDRYDLALGVTPDELRRGDFSAQPETVWREVAYHHRQDLIDVDSAVAIEPKRFDAPYDWADDPELSAEETMRRFNALEPAPIVGVRGYRCEHFKLTYSGAVMAGPPSAGCGCTMQPVYA